MEIKLTNKAEFMHVCMNNLRLLYCGTLVPSSITTSVHSDFSVSLNESIIKVYTNISQFA